MDRNKYSAGRSGETGGQARKSLWIETYLMHFRMVYPRGQARKSLWIETKTAAAQSETNAGQARKSLWIETISACHPVHNRCWSGS